MKETILLGSYTRNVGTGIYQAILDTDAKTLTPAQPYLTIGNPTYLAVSKAHRLYSVATDVDANETKIGGVAAFDLQNFQAPLSINQVMAPGAAPAYVAVDEPRQLVYSANYHTGQALVHRILPDGSLVLADTVTRQGKGPQPEQDSAHIHYTDLTPDQRLVCCDLGSDEVLTFDVTAQGKLTLVATYQTTPGFGPRHLVFHPTLPIAYLIGELGSAVQVLHYDATTGQFTAGAQQSTLAAGFTGHNGGAAIRITRDGHYLYLSNRGENTLVGFAVSADGETLTCQQRISVAGDFPRDFALDPSEAFLVCANQNSSNLTLFQRDPATGQLTQLAANIACSEPVCVHFMDTAF